MTSASEDERLHVEEIRRDRLLVCVRKDHSLASKGILHPEDLRGVPVVLCHPQINLNAHVQTLSYLDEQTYSIELIAAKCGQKRRVLWHLAFA